jgi:hypothetical protein
MMRARSCWYSGARFWIVGTQEDQSRRKGMKTAGQFVSERWVVSGRGDDSGFSLRLAPRRGRGTEGGFEVERSAAK